MNDTDKQTTPGRTPWNKGKLIGLHWPGVRAPEAQAPSQRTSRVFPLPVMAQK
jgi:hypothetical protein